MSILYDLFLFAYQSLIGLAALWNPKARAWVLGRRQHAMQLQRLRSHPGEPVIWMHCASLGEFEQGRPVLESIREAYPQHRILLTFFSPSGYETRKHYAKADLVCYLPLDGRQRSRRFIDQVDPCLALFIKYEHWHYYLAELQSRSIPTLSVSAIFRQAQPFFQPYGAFWRRMLQRYSRIFVQDADSFRLLEDIGMASIADISGDTRFDRVLAVAASPTHIEWMESFLKGRITWVAGSTWPEDEKLLSTLAASMSDIVFIIAPHEIDSGHLTDIEKTFHGAVRFSQYESADRDAREKLSETRVLIVDNIGLLSSLYQYADITYVGGGFNRSGIHNILEAAVYGIPVVFGPRCERSKEAAELIAASGAFVISDENGLLHTASSLLRDPSVSKEAGQTNSNYVRSRAGATAMIIRYIEENRLLSN